MINDEYRARVTLKESIIVVETDDVRILPGVIDLPVYQGNTFTQRIRWRHRGEDQPLTSFTGTAAWASALSGGSVLQSFGTSELTLSTAEPWLITMSLGTATTAAYSGWVRGVGDLTLYHSTYGQHTILEMRPLLVTKVA